MSMLKTGWLPGSKSRSDSDMAWMHEDLTERTPTPPLATSGEAALAFRRLRANLTRNSFQSLWSESRLRFWVVIGCSLFFWLALLVFFYQGFKFVYGFEVFARAIVEYGFSLYFLSLMAMMLFSVGIICYNGFFLSTESGYLLTLPTTSDRLFSYKFSESMAFACWGFFLIGSPLMLAYGISAGAGLLFYLLILPYLIAFVLIAGSLGATAAFLVGRFLPRRPKTILGVGIGSLLFFCIYLGFRVLQSPGDAFSTDWMNGLLGGLAFSQDPLLPNIWMTRGLMGASIGDSETALFYLMVSIANAGMLYLVAAMTARILYRPAYALVQGSRSNRTMASTDSPHLSFHRAFAFIPKSIRFLVLKDLRLFRRDPSQWSQFLVLFGLLGFYFLTIRQLGYHNQYPAWRNLLSFLNLAVTSLLLSTFTSRFVFPLISLEGRNFWILGLLPVKRDALLWGKFVFAAGSAIVVTLPLIILSDIMLRMGLVMTLIHVVMMIGISLGLAAISVGLGARLPNLKQSDPSKIAAGFGGTINLLVSLGFIIGVVFTMALPCHLYLDLNTTDEFTSLLAEGMWQDPVFKVRMGLASTIATFMAAFAIIAPMRMGLKSFRTMEF